jgi:hypothetical protein
LVSSSFLWFWLCHFYNMLVFACDTFLLFVSTCFLFLCLNPNFFSVTITCYHQLWFDHVPRVESGRQCPEVFYLHEKQMMSLNLFKRGQVHKANGKSKICWYAYDYQREAIFSLNEDIFILIGVKTSPISFFLPCPFLPPSLWSFYENSY